MTPRQFFRAVYATRRPKFWRLAPAVLDGDPAEALQRVRRLRPPRRDAQGLPEDRRQRTFFDFARDLGDKHGGGNISRGQFVSEAKQASGLKGGS